MMSQSHQAPRNGYDRPGEESPRTRRGRRGGKRRRRDRSSSPPRSCAVPAIEPARGYQPQLPPRGYAMAPRGWEPRRFAQPESLAQLPPPARARVTPGASLRPTARVVPGAAKRRVVPGSSLGRAPPPPPAKKAMRQNGRALYASRADPNGPTRVEEDPDVRAGQARARRERGAMDRALAAARVLGDSSPGPPGRS